MYSRVVDGETLTFGVSGKLWKNALVMYDRQTKSLWSHLTGECLEGAYKGKKLRMLSAVPIVKWGVWRTAHPQTKVLTLGGREDHRRDNYGVYHRSSDTGLFPPENRNDKLGNKDLVIGVTLGDKQKAYPLKRKGWKTEEKGKWRVVEDNIGKIPVVVYHDPDHFTSSVFKRKVGEKVIRFSGVAEGMIANDTDGRSWNLVTGRGSDGTELEAVPHLNIYWFAWVDFYPGATLYEE